MKAAAATATRQITQEQGTSELSNYIFQ